MHSLHLALIALRIEVRQAIADGRTDEETLKGQWDELITADQQGRLGEVMPGADQAPEQQGA